MLYFYQIYLLKQNAPILTYSSEEMLNIGEIILVPLKNSQKMGVVFKEVKKPTEFETLEIISIVLVKILMK